LCRFATTVFWSALHSALGPEGVVVLTTALGVWDNQHRLDNALGVVAP